MLSEAKLMMIGALSRVTEALVELSPMSLQGRYLAFPPAFCTEAGHSSLGAAARPPDDAQHQESRGQHLTVILQRGHLRCTLPLGAPRTIGAQNSTEPSFG